MMIGTLQTILSILNASSSTAGIYNFFSGIRHGSNIKQILHELGKINLEIEKLSDKLYYSPDLSEYYPNAKTKVGNFDGRDLRELLQPMQSFLHDDILASSVFSTPEKLKKKFKQDPKDVLFDIQPAVFATKPQDENLIPISFFENDTMYVGWQKKQALSLLFDLEFDENSGLWHGSNNSKRPSIEEFLSDPMPNTFQRNGYDLNSKVNISYPEAILGCKKIIQLYNTKVKLSITEGLQSGKLFRLKGLGLYTKDLAYVGDHFLTINIWTPQLLSTEELHIMKNMRDYLSHNTNTKINDYYYDNHDVYYEVRISLPEAILGTEITVPMPDKGKIKVKIDPGIQSGKILRIRNRGLLDLNSNRYGNYYIIVKVVTPFALTKKLRSIFTKLKNSKSFNPID